MAILISSFFQHHSTRAPEASYRLLYESKFSISTHLMTTHLVPSVTIPSPLCDLTSHGNMTSHITFTCVPHLEKQFICCHYFLKKKKSRASHLYSFSLSVFRRWECLCRKMWVGQAGSRVMLKARNNSHSPFSVLNMGLKLKSNQMTLIFSLLTSPESLYGP